MNAQQRLAAALGVLFLLVGPGQRTVASQTAQNPAASAPPQSELSAARITFDYSTAPLWRNAALSDAAWAAFALGVDWGLDAATGDRVTTRSTLGGTSRAVRWALLDVPMAWYTFVWTHEYGHKTRLEEDGLPARVVVQGTPWTGMTAFTQTAVSLRNSTPAMYSSGIEGTDALLRRLDRRLFQSGTAHHAELTAIFVATGMSLGYIQRDLSSGRVRHGGIFRETDPGDPTGYVITLARRRYGDPEVDQMRELADDIRAGSWLNLLDYGLVTVGVGLFRDYLVRGERQAPVRWINLGGVSLAPGLRYEMTPVGPERHVRSWIKIGPTISSAYVRWAEGDRERLIGAGGEFRSPAVHDWQPGIMFDMWENPDGASGARFEANAEWTASPGRWSLTFAVGGKTSGYLIGFPLENGAYGSIGGAVRF